MVHPYFRRRGIGRRLLDEIEKAFPEVNALRGQDRPPEQAQPLPVDPARLSRPSRPSRSRPPSRGFTCKRIAARLGRNERRRNEQLSRPDSRDHSSGGTPGEGRASAQAGLSAGPDQRHPPAGPGRTDLQLRPAKAAWRNFRLHLADGALACPASAPSTGAPSFTRMRCTTCSTCRWMAWRWISRAPLQDGGQVPFGSTKAPVAKRVTTTGPPNA